MFVLAPEADIAGTSFGGTIEIAPTRLNELFGKPEEGDSYKISGLYIFKDWGDNVVTLYDYKCTSLYDSYYPDPEELWSSDEPYGFHIGACTSEIAERFAAILSEID
tara:strand:+ start:3910 stop:4230 length:321 start_codon:yes stop_codon:yes gene_type:complete